MASEQQESPIIPVQPATLVDAIRALREAVRRMTDAPTTGSDDARVSLADDETWYAIRPLYDVRGRD